jgi:hypothetical protein
MTHNKKSPFVMVMMPHLIIIQDGKIINDGYINYDVSHN